MQLTTHESSRIQHNAAGFAIHLPKLLPCLFMVNKIRLFFVYAGNLGKANGSPDGIRVRKKGRGYQWLWWGGATICGEVTNTTGPHYAHIPTGSSKHRFATSAQQGFPRQDQGGENKPPSRKIQTNLKKGVWIFLVAKYKIWHKCDTVAMHFALFLGGNDLSHFNADIFRDRNEGTFGWSSNWFHGPLNVCAMRALWQLLDWIGLYYREGCRQPDADAGVC